MKQQIRFCRAPDGVRIAYTETGEGPPLLRVANWLSHINLDWDSPLWKHWFRELSRGHRLIRYDPRGTGLSDRRVNDLSLEAWVADLEAVVEALDLERFSLLGFCQGGATAVAYAASHPQRVERLVLYDSYLRGSYVDGASPRARREAEALEEMIAVGWGQQSTAFRQVFANLLIPGAALEQQRWLAQLQGQTASPQTAVRLWRAFHQIDIRREAQLVNIPTQVFHVKGDAMVPYKHGLQLAASIPNARFVPLQGKNHILLEQDSAWTRFLRELRGFLGTRKLTSDESQPPFTALTPREREVLGLIAEGLSNPEIAGQLVIAPKTVRNHVTRIYSKLNADSRAQAVVMSREAGIGKQSWDARPKQA